MILKKEKNKDRNKVREITSDSIPIISVDNSGIFEVDTNIYSMTIRLKDINYALSRQEDQEEIFLLFAKLLNYFTADINIQITVNNENVQIGSIKDIIEMDCNKKDGLDEYREEFNDMLLSNAVEGKNNLRKSIYVTVTTECKNINEAKSKLNKVMAEVSANLKRIGSNNSVLVLEERAEVLHDFLRNKHEGEFEYDRNSDTSILSAIAPTGLEFRSDYFKMGDRYCRGVFLSNISSFLSDKFTSEIMEFNENIMLSVHMQGQDIEKTMRMLNNKLTSLKTEEIKAQETAAKNRRFTFSLNPHLREAMEEVEEFKDMILNKNQKVFFTNYILVHMADSKVQLDEDTKTLQSIAGKNLCKLRTLKFKQEEALRSVLPLGVNELKYLDRCLTTESATVLSLPFNSVEYLENNGFYYGRNTLTGNMIMLDKQELKNQNSFVLGSPGSGKSFTTKRELVNVDLTTDADIFVVDPENEYGRLCKALGGEVIEISVNSKTHINPLDMEFDEEEDPLRNKCNFMLTICNKILGGKDGLTPIQTTILDRVCHKVFKKYIDSNYNKKYQPTLVDFLDILEKEKENEAKDLAVGLEIYCKGSLDLFAHKTNVNVNNRFQIYNIQKLGNALKPLGLQICLETIWQKVVKNRELGKQTVVICDEAHLLFGEGNEYSANYMQALYKRSRKYKAWITCITQNITGMLDDKIASSLIANSDFLQILNQSPQDKQALAELLGISDLQLSYVSNANPGEGLLIIGQTNIIPFSDKFPKNLKLYKLMTTDPKELKKFKEEEEKMLELIPKLEEIKLIDINAKLNEKREAKLNEITEVEDKLKKLNEVKLSAENEINLIEEQESKLNIDQESKLKEVTEIEDKLKELNEVKLSAEREINSIEEQESKLKIDQEVKLKETTEAENKLKEVTETEDKLSAISEMQNRLKEVTEIENKLKELNEVKLSIEKKINSIEEQEIKLEMDQEMKAKEVSEFEDKLKMEQENKVRLKQDNDSTQEQITNTEEQRETKLNELTEIENKLNEIQEPKVKKNKAKNKSITKVNKKNTKIKNSNDKSIYCIEEDRLYNNVDEFMEEWGIKNKSSIINVCNRKVKKITRNNGISYDYIQETLKDPRDNVKKHIMWNDNYLKSIKKEA